MSRSRSSRSRALFANCFLVLRSLFRRQKYWPNTKIKRRTLGKRDAKSNPRSFVSRSPRSTLISLIWEREAKRISVWKFFPRSRCRLDAAWEVKIASFCLEKKLDLCPSETSEILVSREFSRIFFHFHFSFSISSRFNFTFTSRKRVKGFYFSLFTSRKKWKLSIFHSFFSRKKSEIRCGL